MINNTQTIIGIIAAAITFVAGYHTLANQSLVESVENTETGVIVDRILRLERIQCSRSLSPDLKLILEQQRSRYYQLTGREFTHTCQ